MKKVIYLLALLIICFSCKTRNFGGKNHQIIYDKIEIEKDIIVKELLFLEILKDSLKRLDLDTSKIKIISFKRGINDYSSLKDTSNCISWKLNENILKQIIKSSDTISNQEWHYLFDVMPCIYKGTLEYDNIVYSFMINGGSWIDIGVLGKDALRLGYFGEKYKQNFLSVPWNPNE